MREAIKLSEQGMQEGHGGPFGAVVVKNGGIIGRGFNRVITSNDPTAHAEVTAIRDACKFLNHFQLDNCVIYTSCEPCPMCMGAIYWARPAAVYYANLRTDAAGIGFDDEFIYQEIGLPLNNRKLLMIPLLRDEALPAFAKWQKMGGKKVY
jgi:tRNA(Arg) A34 adenosine deaminase TadA